MSKLALEAKNRGNVAYKNRDFAAAHAYYDVAIRLSPQEMVLYSNKSAVFFEEGKYDDCIATCEKALEIGSENKNLVEKVVCRIAKAKKAQGKISEAIAWLENASAEHDSLEINKLLADLRLDARRRPLSNAYVNKLIPLLMDIPNDNSAGERTRNLTFSSPIMTYLFVKFMEPYRVTIRDPECAHFFAPFADCDPNIEADYVKNWTAFSWIAPFIEKLAIDGALPEGRPPNWAYEMLPRTSSVMTFFRLWVPDYIHDPLNPNVMPFIRRQLPNLSCLHGPIEFFLELPPNPPEPRKFDDISLVIRKFSALPKLFETKRFTAVDYEFKFIQPPSGDFDYAGRFIDFLRETTLRLPETRRMMIRMPVLRARFPAGDLVNALQTIFPGMYRLTFNVSVSGMGKPLSLNRERLVSDFAFLKQEMEKMPRDLRVEFNIEDYAGFFDNETQIIDVFQTVPPDFKLRTPWNKNMWNPTGDGYVSLNPDHPVCHGNKWFFYEVLFE